jgi:hypothetical protein
MLTKTPPFFNPRRFLAMTTRLSAIKQISVNARDLPRAMSFFDCGGIRLLIGVAEKGELDHPSSILYFNVDDIGAAHAELKAKGVVFRDEPHLVARLPDREIWLSFFEDTEGNVLAITSEISAK